MAKMRGDKVTHDNFIENKPSLNQRNKTKEVDEYLSNT